LSAWVIDVEGLTKRYGDKVVVDQIDLQLKAGRICGFLGPNGSGKTTTIRMLCGLLTPDAGRGSCLGFDINTQSLLIKREVGYMTQKFGLYEDLSIQENLDFVARLFEIPKRSHAVSRALEELGLTSRAKQLAGSLSGGWKQRLALAACLLHRPKLLLLDEPTAGVDPKARRQFWDQIHELADQGITVLVSTHYMDEAQRCHELFYIAYGKMLASGSEKDIVQSSGIIVYEIQGEGLVPLATDLRNMPEVMSVASFGNSIHVASKDEKRLASVLTPLSTQANLRVQKIQANLEDVFIGLLANVQDNYKN
jgi:ABC-2 type transport system ATP-binding protein